MTTPELPTESIPDHIARLERGHRKLTAVVLMLVLAIVALLAWQLYPGTRPIEGKRFVLRDERGIRRAELVMNESGGPMLRLNDSQGKARVQLALRDNGSVGMRMADNEGVNRVDLRVGAEGEPELLFMNPDGRSRARIGLSDGRGSITLRDPERGVVWSSPAK